jgi:hypothetical protein
MNNYFNYLIEMFEMLTDDIMKRKFIEKMKINIGITFFNDFKYYCLYKLATDHELIKLMG